MAKTIKFSHNDKDYTLEFTRKTVRMLERGGFSASDITEKPVNTIPELFKGAFLAHHQYIKADVVEAIFNQFTNKSELLGKLIEMYHEPFSAMLEEPEDNEGNIQWGADF